MNMTKLKSAWRFRSPVLTAALAAFVLSLGAPVEATAQGDFPNRPVRIILGFGPGGVADISARLLSEHLEEAFGQRFLVENVPGAGGAVATQMAFTSDSEGYTLLNMGNAATIRRTTMPNLKPDQIDDFDPVSPISEFNLGIVTAPDSDIKTVQDLVDKAKENPAEVNIGTVVVGSTQHLAAVLFSNVADVDYAVVPYKSSPELMGAVARGEVDAAFEIIAGAKSAIESGQVRLVATTKNTRSAVFPDTPTVEESGVTPFNVSSWNSYVTPKGTPPEVIAKLNAEIQRIMAIPEVREKMLSFGMEPYVGGPEVVSERQQTDIARWREVVLEAGIPIEE